jgi:hypothetical protein
MSNDTSYLWQMVHTQSADELVLDIPEPSTGHGQAPLPLPVDIAQMLATQHNLMTTQNDLMMRLVENNERRFKDRWTKRGGVNWAFFKI